MTVAPASAAVRTASASVSTSPTRARRRRPDGRKTLLDCRIDRILASGATPTNVVPASLRVRADDAGDDRAVAVAVLGAVAGRHVVTAGEEMGQQSVPGDAGVDHGDGLAGAPRQPPRRLEFGEVWLRRR